MRAWRSFCQLGILGGVLASVLHCGSDSGSTFNNGTNTAACTSAYAGKCGVACTDDTSCAAGLYCNGSKVCAADCAPSVACADTNQSCGANGTCAGGGGGGSCGFSACDASDGTDGGFTILPDGGKCGNIDITLAKTEPYVLFVLDQSSSMYIYKFPGESVDSNASTNGVNSRWETLKTALLGANDQAASLVKNLQGNAQLAVALYSGTDSNTGDGDNTRFPTSQTTDLVCPRFNGRSFANAFPGGLTFSDSSFQAISNSLRPAGVDDDTPTGYAIQTLVGLDNSGAVVAGSKGFASFDAKTAPKLIVLVTDGEAGNCVNAQYSDNATGDTQQQQGAAKTLAMVQAAYRQKISTFVIDIGGAAVADAFKEVANAGQGMDPDNGTAKAFTPQNATDLTAQIQSVVTNARSCTFQIDGTIVAGQESSGTVLVNGKAAPFGTGWTDPTPSSITLLGDFCTTVKTDPNATLKATFPCGAATTNVPK